MLICAEAGINHDGDLSRAMHFIDMALKSGADEVKFQIYDAHSLALRRGLEYKWNKDQIFEHFELLDRYSLSFEDWSTLAAYGCGKIFASVFSARDLHFAASVGGPDMARKLTHERLNDRELVHEFVRHKTNGKPKYFSVTKEKIGKVSALKGHAIPLLCVADYPANPSSYDWDLFNRIKREWGGAGVSDHTQTDEVPLQAFRNGACILERHVTLDTGASGPDHHMSTSFDELAAIAARIKAMKSKEAK